MTGLILAAGVGERLSNDETHTTCKPLKKVNGIPLIFYSLVLLKEVDIDRIIIVVGKYYEEIQKVVGNYIGNIKIEYEIQKEQKGLSNAIVCGCRNCDDDVILMLADELFIEPKLSECVKTFKNDSLDYLVTYTKETDPERIKANFSFEVNENDEPSNFVEKPKDVVNDMKGTGVCIFSGRSIQLLKDRYNEETNIPNTLCDYFELLNEEKILGKAFGFAATEVNVNTLKDLEYADRLLKGDV